MYFCTKLCFAFQKIKKAMSDSSIYCNLCSCIIKKEKQKCDTLKGWKQFNDFAIDQKRVRLKKPSCETEKTLVTCRAKEKLEADLKPRYK